MKKTFLPPPPYLLFILSFSLMIFASCKKEPFQEIEADEVALQKKNARLAGSAQAMSSGTCVSVVQSETVYDTLQTQTLLGYKLVNNPYSVTKMRQAYQNLYGTTATFTANKKYVRFKPANETQLKTLVEQDLDLYDYPLDYEVTQQGDYYNQGLPATEIPWFYTVVNYSYTPPTGITYQVLENIYVPDNDIYLENEAFRITGNPIDSLQCSGSASTMVVLDDPGCPEGTEWDPMLRECVPLDPSDPPSPPPSTLPGGGIKVFDNTINQEVAVRRTRIRLRRWFKFDYTITDDNGQFTSSRNFRKVNVKVEFSHPTNLTIRGVRGVRFWQVWLPMSQNIGKYSGDLRNVYYVFQPGTDVRKRQHRNWWAAQMMNSYLEFNTHAQALNIGTVPSNLAVLLTNWGFTGGVGSAPMNKHRVNAGTMPLEWINYFLANPVNAMAAQSANFLMNSLSLRATDMTLGYNTGTVRRSDRVKALLFHELGHASHFNKVGETWWNSFVFAETSSTVQYSGVLDPYGDGTNVNSAPIIALGESWAEHVGRTISDRQYGMSSTTAFAHNTSYNNSTARGLSSHLISLEDFSPNFTLDPQRWIPDGIYRDLFDLTNESLPVNDQVSGYSNLQFFNALDSDVKSMQQFRQRLLSENGNNQATSVNTLFSSYNY